MSRPTVFFFDIDGTLLDSAPDICGAVRQVCRDFGRPELPDEVIRGYIGRTLAEMFRVYCPEAAPDQIEQMTARYRERYRERGHQSTRVYPGIAEALAALEGRKSTATTKTTATASAVLELFGLRGYFDHVQGSDNGRYKPDPAILIEAMAALGARSEDCIMIGDAPPDIEAGRRAGMRTCAVGWGYGDGEELRRLEPDFWVEAPGGLLGVQGHRVG